MVNFKIICGVFLGTKPDHIKSGEKKELKIIQDPEYHRYGSTVDLDCALETFVPHRLGWTPQLVKVHGGKL